MATPFPPLPPGDANYTRAQFLRQSAGALGAFAYLTAVPAGIGQVTTPTPPFTERNGPGSKYDLREFVSWIENELEPAVRVKGPAGSYARELGGKTSELYGTADMACILYSIGKLHPTEEERTQWAESFNVFQDPKTGFLLEKDPSHPPLHNTAFALAAMQLLELRPKHPLVLAPEYHEIKTYLKSLDWKTKVYPESHKGAGIGSIFTLVPELHSPPWFEAYFSVCDGLFDPHNGLMGEEKPASGDFDQVGGTFHYAFLYQAFNRPMPYPEKRIDTVLGLQQPDGYWNEKNHLWLTLDAIYLLTRTLRQKPYRRDEVVACVERTMDALMRDVFSPEGRKKTFVNKLGVHSVTAAISIVAEAQNFLGADRVLTEWPVRLVLDRRPFI